MRGRAECAAATAFAAAGARGDEEDESGERGKDTGKWGRVGCIHETEASIYTRGWGVVAVASRVYHLFTTHARKPPTKTLMSYVKGDTFSGPRPT